MRELELLDYVYGHNRQLPAHILVPPGDDMGAVRVGQSTVLITVDQIADGVHVDLATAPLELIGRKAITRNLSDVAAMAAQPVGAVVAMCLPRDMTADQAHELLDAMRETGRQYRCPIIGGDFSFWDGNLLISATVLAEPAGIDPVRRDGAQPGDIIYITGHVGGAWSSGGGAVETPHLTFEPRIDLARKLARTRGVKLHSMIDLSDGLASDLPRICQASSVAAELDVEILPLRQHAYAAAARDGNPAWLHGLTDGEDYELCFTISAAAARKLPRNIGDVPLTAIGRVLAAEEASSESPVWLNLSDGRRVPMTQSGWEHQT